MSTPKEIAKQIKAKGLQKLRWYCQMCSKQCRDENGFRNHCTSEPHQRNMLLFAESSNRITADNTSEFLRGFMSIFAQRYGGRPRVLANTVYQEYIQDRHHIHMNATRFKSLSEFVKYLGREGLAEIEEDERGWFITYIDKNPESIARQQALERRAKMEQTAEEIERQRLAAQVERANQLAAATSSSDLNQKKLDSEGGIDLERTEGAPIKLTVLKRPAVFSSNPLSGGKKPNVFKQASSSSSSLKSKQMNLHAFGNAPPTRRSALDEIREEEEARKRKRLNL